MLSTVLRKRPLYWVYLMLIVTILIGMVHKLSDMGLTRRAATASKLLLMVIVVFCLLANLVREKKLYFDDIPIIVYVVYELIVSQVRGFLIFPHAYVDILTWPCLYLFFKGYTRKRAIPANFEFYVSMIRMLKGLLFIVPFDTLILI